MSALHPVQILRNVTLATKTALGLSVLHYEHGNTLEVVNTLIKMSQTPEQSAIKYPLIAVLGRIPMTAPGTATGLRKARLPKVVICCLGSKTAKAEERYQTSFDDTLVPIYNEFMLQLTKSAYILNPVIPSHIANYAPYWGKEGLYGNEAHMLTDAMDCIEILNLELTLGTERPCSTSPQPFKNF